MNLFSLFMRLYGKIIYEVSRLNIKALTYYKTSLVKGEHGKISGGATLANPSHIFLGKNTYINAGSYLHAGDNSKIVIGDNCLISYNVHMRTIDHIHLAEEYRLIREQGLIERDIVIGNNVWIGYGAQVLPGVTIGNDVIIGAGAVVVNDIGDNSVAVGVPAKKVKNVYNRL